MSQRREGLNSTSGKHSRQLRAVPITLKQVKISPLRYEMTVALIVVTNLFLLIRNLKSAEGYEEFEADVAPHVIDTLV